VDDLIAHCKVAVQIVYLNDKAVFVHLAEHSPKDRGGDAQQRQYGPDDQGGGQCLFCAADW
jgi:hypothetical protein